jgi:RNA polymerase sigma-70 factor, ECF subfamily
MGAAVVETCGRGGAQKTAEADRPVGSDLAVHVPALRAAARVLCRHADDYEDVVQDTLERALRHLARNDQPVRNTRAWLMAILRNTFVDRIRTRRSTSLALEDCLAPAEPEPEPAWLDLTLADVRAASASIAPSLRDIFELFHLEGLCYREIATRLSVPENTVASRLFRARNALRDRLLAWSEERNRRDVRRLQPCKGGAA